MTARVPPSWQQPGFRDRYVAALRIARRPCARVSLAPVSVGLTLRMSLRSYHIQRQGGRCAHCQEPFDRRLRVATLDHIVPRADGGEDTEENTQALCRGCNEAKANKPDDVARRMRGGDDG